MDEEAILGGLQDLPDFDYEDFEAGSTGQGRRGEDPGRDTPRSRGRYLIPDLAIAGEGDLPRVGHPGLMIALQATPEDMLELVGLLRGSRYRLLQPIDPIPPVSQVTLGQRRCLICTSRRCSRGVRCLVQSRKRSISLLTKSGY